MNVFGSMWFLFVVMMISGWGMLLVIVIGVVCFNGWNWFLLSVLRSLLGRLLLVLFILLIKMI